MYWVILSQVAKHAIAQSNIETYGIGIESRAFLIRGGGKE